MALVLGLFGHTENAEFVLYLVAFAGALPLAFVSVTWRRDSLTAKELAALGAIDAAGLAVALTAIRLVAVGPRPTHAAMLITGVGVLVLSEVLARPFRGVLARVSRAVRFDQLVIPFFFLAALLFLPGWTYRSVGFWLAFPVALLLAAIGPSILRPRRALALLDAVEIGRAHV